MVEMTSQFSCKIINCFNCGKMFLFLMRRNLAISTFDSKMQKITRRNKGVVLCLVQIDIHTYISATYVYIYYLFV